MAALCSNAVLAKLLIALVRLYQLTISRLIRAVFGPVCRFTPSCSAYAVQCLRLHGAWRGSLLSVRRLSKCHSLHPGGYDPPPAPRSAAGRPEPTAVDAGPTVSDHPGTPK